MADRTLKPWRTIGIAAAVGASAACAPAAEPPAPAPDDAAVSGGEQNEDGAPSDESRENGPG